MNLITNPVNHLAKKVELWMASLFPQEIRVQIYIKTIATLLVFSGLTLTTTHSVKAESHALLVGVSDYGGKLSLEGPQYDLPAVHTTLTDFWQVKPRNIITLLDQEATKDNIIKQMKALEARAKPGDHIFIYLSGHGTSALDTSNNFPLPTTSGAYIPYDVKTAKSASEVADRLLVGRRDIRPILEKMDTQDRTVLVVIDACYSGNTVRGAYQEFSLPTRNADLTELLLAERSDEFGDFGSGDFGSDLAAFGSDDDWDTSEPEEPYPYKRVYYLSASGEHEVAQDIPSNLVEQFGTIDNQPHGAFTDTLLRALRNPDAADSNRDGLLSYVELKQHLRTKMLTRGFSHTPQGLPSAADDSIGLAMEPILGRNLAGEAPTQTLAVASASIPTPNAAPAVITAEETVTTTSSQLISIALSPDLASLKTELAAIPYIAIDVPQSQYRLIQKDNRYLLLTGAGDTIFSTKYREEIRDQLQYRAFIKELQENPPGNSFTAQLELQSQRKGSTAVIGDRLGFDIKTSETAQLLLLDYDAKGYINVIYPYKPRELKPLVGNENLPLHNIAKVQPPSGMDYITLHAFKYPVAELESFMNGTFHYESNESKLLHKLLEKNSHHAARAELDLIIVDQGI